MSNNVSVYIFYKHFSERDFINKELQAYMNVSVTRQLKIDSLIDNSARKKSLYSELLMTYSLCNFANLSSIPVIETSEFGKPYICKPNVFFNLSHSENFICCAVSSNQVGVDIEYHNLKLNPYILSDVLSKERDSLQISFFDYWCLKESYLKYLGIGLLRPLESFSLIKMEPFFSAVDFNCQNVESCLLTKHIHKNYSFAICLSQPSKIDFKLVTSHDLFKNVKDLG